MTAEQAIDVLNRLRIWDFEKDGNVIRGVGGPLFILADGSLRGDG